MSKLLTALIAAGFGFGLNVAVAQNVKSDSDKAKGQEEIMQQKDQGAGHNDQGQRNRPTTDDGRSAQGAQTNGQSTGADKSGTDNSSAAQDQNAPQTQSGQKIPDQSAPSVGHPNEGKPTGQGEAVRKQNQQDTGAGSQDNSSTGQAGPNSDQGGAKKKRMQQ